MKIVELENVDSTNNYLKENHSFFTEITMVIAKNQTKGRGQRGNSWESEPGKNLTFSVLFRPENFAANRQFLISELTALAITDALRKIGIEAKVKWPNDIYVGDKKICGILIEHSIMGSEIERTIIGAGVNINQEKFFSDAPNPVSAFQLTGQKYDLEKLRTLISISLQERLSQLNNSKKAADTHKEFMRNLWRGDERFYPFKDMTTHEFFDGRISGVEESGHLLLEDRSGKINRYAFKEVRFIL